MDLQTAVATVHNNLIGAVEDSLQLDIETPEPAGIHRPLALTTTADNGLRIANN